jgi:hypothetical protein
MTTAGCRFRGGRCPPSRVQDALEVFPGDGRSVYGRTLRRARMTSHISIGHDNTLHRLTGPLTTATPNRPGLFPNRIICIRSADMLTRQLPQIVGRNLAAQARSWPSTTRDPGARASRCREAARCQNTSEAYGSSERCQASANLPSCPGAPRVACGSQIPSPPPAFTGCGGRAPNPGANGDPTSAGPGERSGGAAAGEAGNGGDLLK